MSIILATQEVEIQEDCDSKPAWTNSLQNPILKNPSQKRAGGVVRGVDPEFKSQHRQKKKKRNKGEG
jgi:hypothetical protein